ncbi:hypothetical protein BH23GEM3_BH23GEM3_26100 [soil metagenome]|nr:prepilin-type N-terminal cleavage/methylation domain-containing protein [Gemmatimonadota bacterium]
MRCSSTPAAGFTLIEVLMAMVILAVGLLGLQGLSVAAVQSVGFADRGTRAAATAVLYLEDAVQQIRAGVIPGSCTGLTLANGDLVTRAVTIDAGPGAASVVSVTVTPEPRGGAPRPFSVQSRAYSPVLPEVPGAACPE